jgi:hypothetical protein
MNGGDTDVVGSYENRWYVEFAATEGIATETVLEEPQQQEVLLCAETLLA